MSGPLSVLLLEDCSDDAQLILRKLRRSGYDPRDARVDNAADLQAALARQSWDIVISDYSLPGFDGMAALQMVRASFPDLPFLIVSGAIGEETAVAAIKAGANDYLMKDRLSRLPMAVARELHAAATRQAAKRAEAALRDSSERLRLALENARHGMWDWDVVTGQAILDENWHTILGYQPGELSPTVQAWEQLIHPDDREHVLAVLQQHLNSPESHYDVDYRSRHKYGEWIWINSRGRVCQRDAAGTPLRMMGTIQDVSERKLAEILLAERAKELARSNDELEQFAYVASHDLREPLRMVQSFCGLLQDRYGAQLDERANKYLNFAVDGAARMQHLVDDLLEFSRVGRSNERFESVRLNDVVRQALIDLQTAIEESGATIELDPLPTIYGDAMRLSQVFQNVIGNAIKFRSQKPPAIKVAAFRESDGWQITVADNGIGIDPQHF